MSTTPPPPPPPYSASSPDPKQPFLHEAAPIMNPYTTTTTGPPLSPDAILPSYYSQDYNPNHQRQQFPHTRSDLTTPPTAEQGAQALRWFWIAVAVAAGLWFVFYALPAIVVGLLMTQWQF